MRFRMPMPDAFKLQVSALTDDLRAAEWAAWNMVGAIENRATMVTLADLVVKLIHDVRRGLEAGPMPSVAAQRIDRLRRTMDHRYYDPKSVRVSLGDVRINGIKDVRLMSESQLRGLQYSDTYPGPTDPDLMAAIERTARELADAQKKVGGK